MLARQTELGLPAPVVHCPGSRFAVMDPPRWVSIPPPGNGCRVVRLARNWGGLDVQRGVRATGRRAAWPRGLYVPTRRWRGAARSWYAGQIPGTERRSGWSLRGQGVVHRSDESATLQGIYTWKRTAARRALVQGSLPDSGPASEGSVVSRRSRPCSAFHHS